MNVVVTGATSMIGVALINECIRNNDSVLAVVRKDSNHIERLPQSDLIKIVYCDLDELYSFEYNKKKYDVFFHLAWGFTNKIGRDNPELQSKNIAYTLDAVNLANRLGCTKFIGAGSQAEYGRVHEIIDENTIINPEIAYGMAKHAANILSKRLCEQLNIHHIWTRIFSVYGVHDNENTLIDYAIKQFIKGEKAFFSAATNVWNYLYETDAGRIMYLLGKCDINEGIYCVASNESKTLKEFIQQIAEAFGKNVVYEFAVANDESKGSDLNVNINKLLTAIDYMPKVSFSEGIQMVINKMKEKY